MKLFKHSGQWDTPILVEHIGLGLTPEPVLVDWYGAFYLAPKELLANGLEQLGVYRKLKPKDELPLAWFELAHCIPVPQAVAKILIEELLDHH